MKVRQLTEGSSLFLDLVRAISVQLVVVGHGIGYCAIITFLQPPHFPYMQNIAVVIFFILSGYLISNSISYKLSTDDTYSFRSYFIDRFSRIYTALIPALLFVIVIDYISQNLSPESYAYSSAFNVKTLIGNLFMLQDFPLQQSHILILGITSFGSARPLWTLAVEWWIYLWFGVITIIIIRVAKPSLLTFIGLFFLSIVPAWNLIYGRGSGLTLYWIFGVMIGVVYDNYKTLNLTMPVKIGILISLLILACLRFKLTKQEYDPIFAFLLAGCLLIGIDLCSTLKVDKKISRIIRLSASYSYTLFLIHYSIYDFIVFHIKDSVSPYLLFLMGFAISNIFAFAIGYFTETKFTIIVKKRLKARFA